MEMTQAFDKILEPYYYYVVKFLEKPGGIVNDYACVPDFWTKPTGSTDWVVSVPYPEENPVITPYRAKMGEEPQDHWKLYQAIIKYISKSYIDPEIWISKYHATAENKRSTEKGYQSVSALGGMARSSGDFPSIPNTKTLQTVVAPSKPSQKPMIRVSPVVRNAPESTAPGADINENWSQTANAVASTKRFLFEYINPIDPKIHAVQRYSYLSKYSSQQPKHSVQKQIAPVIQYFPQEVPRKPEITQRIPVCVENLVREIRTHEIAAERSNNVQIMMFTAPTIQKPLIEAHQHRHQSSSNQKTEHIATQSSQNAKEQISSNTQSIRNYRTTEQNNIQNASAVQSITKETRSNKRHVRKPKYNPNNSKWTLKYRRRERGLQELVQDTGIYVNVIELAHCRRASDNCNTLARMLLTEVFSHKALTLCSLNGDRGKVHDDNKIRHELDEFAIKVILKFVEDYGMENQWDKFDYKSVTKSMHYEISKIKAKYGN